MKNRRIEYYLRNDILLDTPEEYLKDGNDPLLIKGCLFEDGKKTKYIKTWIMNLDLLVEYEQKMRDEFDVDIIINRGIIDPVLDEDQFNEIVEKLY